MEPLDRDFAIKYRLSDSLDEMRELEEALLTVILKNVPAERRLRGLSLKERLAGLSEEETVKLRELLDRKQGR